jgi:hypothetical protein
MQLKMPRTVTTPLLPSAFLRRALPVAALAWAQALSACSAADVAESADETAEIEEAFTATAGLMSGVSSYEGTIVSRGTGKLDLFVRSDSGTIVFHRYLVGGGGWLPGVDLGRPPGVTLGTSVAAAVNGGRLDLFVVTSTGRVYQRTSNVTLGEPTWGSWVQVPDVTVKAPSALDAITVTSWGPGRLDLFYITPNGNLGHKWGDNNAWSGVESGDNAATWYLKPPGAFAYSPPIESVSTKLGRLDIILGSQTGAPGLKHHAYYGDVNGWQQPVNVTCCSDGEGGNFAPTDFVVAKMNPITSTSFSVFVKHGSIGGRIEQLAWQNGWFQPSGSVVPFDRSQQLSLTAINLTGAVQYSGGLKTAIVGAYANTISGWLATFP